jgi:hypothetical protein
LSGSGQGFRSIVIVDTGDRDRGLEARFCSEFLQEVAEVFAEKVIIRVDELDKITVTQLFELLKGIKGILGQENTHFMLTISEDAISLFNERWSRERSLVECPRLMSDAELAEVLKAFVAEIEARPPKPSHRVERPPNPANVSGLRRNPAIWVDMRATAKSLWTPLKRPANGSHPGVRLKAKPSGPSSIPPEETTD